MAVFRNVTTSSQVTKSLVDINTLFFGGLTLVSLAVFFYFAKFRASSRQRDREDRIDWGRNRFRCVRTLLLIMLGVLVVALIAQRFLY
jgi:4-amino-4-deoxy-L-arabinose transferase-like glycosyltransferase